LKDYCENRLILYAKRKQYLIEQKEEELVILSAKAKFILAVLDNTIDMRNIDDDDLVSKMNELELPMRNEKENDILSGWDYLLRMPMRSMTRKLVEKILEQKDQVETELSELRDTTTKQMWRSDLVVFKKS